MLKIVWKRIIYCSLMLKSVFLPILNFQFVPMNAIFFFYLEVLLVSILTKVYCIKIVDEFCRIELCMLFFRLPMKNDNIMNCAIALKYISTSCILDSLKFVNHIHKHLRVYNIAIFHFDNSSNFAMDFLTFWIYHSTESSMNWSDVTYLPPSQSKLTESILTGDFFKIHIFRN